MSVVCYSGSSQVLIVIVVACSSNCCFTIDRSKAGVSTAVRRVGIKSGGDAGTTQKNQQNNKNKKQRLVIHVEEESADDVIDLGPPPRRRRPGAPPRPHRSLYTPNPRLYSPPVAVKAPRRRRRAGGAGARRVGRPPNPRLYTRPPPRRAPPPPAPPVPPPPPPPASVPLDTASRAALRLRAMEGESAPAELLAEFLSATLQRQYGAALECCRRILQFEPHNATARAFYPLLCHRLSAERLQRHAQAEAEAASATSAGASTAAPAAPAAPTAPAAPALSDDDDTESERSISDSSSARGSSRSNRDSEDSSSASLVSLNTPASYSNSGGGRWSNSQNSSPDENGNEPDLMPADENDNGSSESATDISVQEDNALKQLRARFACSIK